MGSSESTMGSSSSSSQNTSTETETEERSVSFGAKVAAATVAAGIGLACVAAAAAALSASGTDEDNRKTMVAPPGSPNERIVRDHFQRDFQILQLDNEAEKWMNHYSSKQKILLVGEGDRPVLLPMLGQSIWLCPQHGCHFSQYPGGSREDVHFWEEECEGA